MELNKPKMIKKLKNIYVNNSIYMLNYLNGENIVVSYGLLTEINEGNGINIIAMPIGVHQALHYYH